MADSESPVVEGRDAIRESVLAEIETLTEGDEAPKAEPAEGEPEKEAPEPKADEPAEEEKEAPADEEAEDEDTDEEEVAAKGDTEQDKRLAAVQRAEKRAKEAVAKERETFERQREAFQREWGPRVEAAEAFEKLKERAQRDPSGALEALGVTDFDYAARQNYLRSKAAQADPKSKEAADRLMREREHASELERTKAEIAELRAEMQAQRTQQQIVDFIDQAAKAADESTPLVRNLLSKDPARARHLLAVATQHLIDQTGEKPDHADVVKALEDHERAELEARGIDYSAIKATPKKTTPAAGEKRTATRTLSNDLGSPSTPRSAPKSRREERDEVARALEEGRLDF